MKKIFNKIIGKIFGYKLNKINNIDYNEIKEEKEYWVKQLQSIYSKYNLQMDPIQTDEKNVPPIDLVKKHQYSKHAIPDFFFGQGYRDAYELFKTLEKNSIQLDKVSTVLDFGVAFSRLLINWFPFNASLYGCDITPEGIQWSQKKHGNRAKISFTNPKPPLPYDNNYFDVIYAIAVFIHIPYAKQEEWIKELKRISKPGGYVAVTYYEPSINLINWEPRLVDEKLVKPGYFERRGNKNLNYDATDTFIDRDVIVDMWGKYFSPIEYTPRFKKHSIYLFQNDED
ncbi:MAG: class I SAM-dependent methyltransferase [Candidatus Paceibacterota bacterium]